MLQEGDLGIHPAGALGVGFYVHTAAECFIGRGGNGITQLLKEAGSLKLLDDEAIRVTSLKNRIFSNLLEADALHHLPELLFVCCNPDQLHLFTGEMVRYLENLAGRGKLKGITDIRRHVPILLVLPNGILSEQTIQTYEEQLRESVLLRRLPDVDEEIVAALLDRVVRGISLQAGGRRGSGADTVYVLERKGTLVFAGGGDFEQRRISVILSNHGYPATHARDVPGTRIEFDKAMISIVLNVGGLIHTVKANGDLLDLRMGDLCKDPTKADFVRRVTRAVLDVGLTCGAYAADASYDEIWARHHAMILAHAGHVTSSLKFFHDALDRGLESVQLFSNEEWILGPLIRYASNAGLKEEETLFKSLRCQVQNALARAIRYRKEHGQNGNSGASTMKLSAQRNISIELFECGKDEMLLVGTLLDHEHLIKLEIKVYLPDEQITSSRLQMIRVPFPVCREVESVAERLVGLRIERGVLNEIGQRIGGRVGCSHIKELATSMVYFVASQLVQRRAGMDPMSTSYAMKPPEERFTLTKELLRDSCLAYCQITPLGLDEQIGIKRVGEEHTHPVPVGDYENSLGVVLRTRAERWGDRTYIRRRLGAEDQEISWKKFASDTFQIARHLMKQGIQPGDRIAMLSENRVEMFNFELAAMSIGAVSVPIFQGYPKRQVAYVLGHARPRFVVASGTHQLNKIDRGQHPNIVKYFCMDSDRQSEEWGAVDYTSLLNPGGVSKSELTNRIDAVIPDDLCFVMYTSGTTGPPKGVKLSHGNIISQQKAIGAIWDVGPSDVVMSYLPWHHSFGGLFERFMCLYHGCTHCLDDSRGRDIERLIDNWAAFKPTLFFSVPRVHDLLITQCRQRQDVSTIVFGQGLRFVFTAGAALPAHVETAYQQHNIPVVEGWGLTETSPCVTMTDTSGPWRSGYVGFPIPGVTVRIDSDGEILVKGPNVMAGYLDDEDATSRVIDDQGWFHSGDLGEFTDRGLRLMGRKDGAFKLTTGEKVHPQRVETVLVNESPYISTAVALGRGKDFVSALIHPDFDRLREWAADNGIQSESLIGEAAVRELFATELARVNLLIEVKYQRVRRVVLIDREPTLEAGELTPSGKVVRSAIMKNCKVQIEKLFVTEPPDDVIEIQQRQLQGI
ncbi:MAG: AMP-binding protein [Planctomycetes bacterium]|nr:AMP-binding protein [Planctomycetota bacterium]